MRIVTVRRISQTLFLLLLVGFCVVASPGEAPWQLRGWPVNAFLAADPLLAVATTLATGVLFSVLALAAVTLVLTILLGRFFCGWVCPLGTMQQAVGWLGRRRRPLAEQVRANRYRRAQALKYYLLAFLLAMASGTLAVQALRGAGDHPRWLGAIVAGLLLAAAAAALAGVLKSFFRAAVTVLLAGIVCAAGALAMGDTAAPAASLQVGLLDPIALVYRSVNLVVLPAVDSSLRRLWPVERFSAQSWLIGGIFAGVLLASLVLPRFFCRFLCPLGALLGVCGRFSLYRVGQRGGGCTSCSLCERNCEGACEPTGKIRTSECVLCMNCLDDCVRGTMAYRRERSDGGEIPGPDVSRRGVLLSLAGGLAAVPVLRLSGRVAGNFNARLIRPPGSREESEFLRRCIKCGQCMRVCPTNVLQPAGLEMGLEALWTPVLNNRIGSSGCRQNCVACSRICPTGAIYPLSLQQRMGVGDYADRGPVRIGTAYVDRGRCLPWAMDRPCLVCQENCPVSPKAIFARESFHRSRDGLLTVRSTGDATVTVSARALAGRNWASGDYYLAPVDAFGGERRRILACRDDTITLEDEPAWEFPPQPGDAVEVLVRLQRPWVDPARCIGCGVCEHECPVSGRRAIRVTAENETRSRERSLLP